MARTIRTKVYQFNELTEQAKQVAIEWYRTGNFNDSEFVWDNILNDAKGIGLNIISIDDDRPNKGEFIHTAINCAQLIIANHGNECETYKTAANFISEFEAIEQQAIAENKDGDEEYWFDNEIEEYESSFLQSLLEDYRIMYNKDCDYQNTDENIIENIQANEYEFTADGRRF